LKAQTKKRKTRSPGDVLSLHSRPKAFISSEDVLKANRERDEKEAARYGVAESSSGEELDDMVIDDYGMEIILDKKTKRSLSPAMKSKIATGKYISRKKGPKLTLSAR
jgi:hypothetical protein